MTKILVFFILIPGMTLRLNAQSSKSPAIKQMWIGYFNQTRINNKWAVWVDLHLRTNENYIYNFSQSIIRAGLTYCVSDEARITAGYAYVSVYPSEGNKKITRPEYRPWQQIQWLTGYGQKVMTQRVRLEEQFRRKLRNDSTLDNDNSFNYRIGYIIGFDFPLGKTGVDFKGLFLVVNDEIKINFGKGIGINYFDQNRIFVGLKYQLNHKNSIQFGYMNQYQKLSPGIYREGHIIRVNYLQNFDLKLTSGKKHFWFI